MTLSWFPTSAYDRIKDLHIARAATEIACQAVANVYFTGIRISFKQIHRCHHHARRADTALCSTAINERLLNSVQLVTARDAFDSFDGRTFNLRNGYQTAVYNPAIDDDGARATLAFTTTFLRARQMKLLAQHVEQTFHWEGLKHLRLTVDDAVDRLSFNSSWHFHSARQLLANQGKTKNDPRKPRSGTKEPSVRVISCVFVDRLFHSLSSFRRGEAFHHCFRHQRHVVKADARSVFYRT